MERVHNEVILSDAEMADIGIGSFLVADAGIVHETLVQRIKYHDEAAALAARFLHTPDQAGHSPQVIYSPDAMRLRDVLDKLDILCPELIMPEIPTTAFGGLVKALRQYRLQRWLIRD